MKAHIDSVLFGSITVNGVSYDHDIYITLDGKVQKRKKKLSKQVFGTSHVISLTEAEYFYEKESEKIIIGAGHNGMVILSNEADDFLKMSDCKVILLPTPDAVKEYNKSTGKVLGMFHVTC
jgi:hypothetical protein